MSSPSLPMLVQMDAKALREVRELDFNKAIVAYALAHGWLCHYERRSGHVGKNGEWRGSGPKGRPDLLLAWGGIVLLAELKREGKDPTDNQKEWLAQAGEHGRLWRPHDAAEIMRELGREPDLALRANMGHFKASEE